MKLSTVLGIMNQFEKSKFINTLDKICTESAAHDTTLAAEVDKLDVAIKNASKNQITQLFALVESGFEQVVRDQLAMKGGQAALLTNILSRDGNCMARVGWIEKLYSREWLAINSRAEEISQEISALVEGESYTEARRFKIYHSCYHEAYFNEVRNNRDARVNDDERSILNVLAKSLEISVDDQVAIEHLVSPLPKNDVEKALEDLREIGLVFISKKHHAVYVADEVVAVLLRIQGKELRTKHLVRILRTLSDPELSNIFKAHQKRFKGKDRTEKIKDIVKFGLPVSEILQCDMHAPDSALNERKERLKQLMTDLDLEFDKIGSTIEERVELILDALNGCADDEFESLSAAGYKELFAALQQHFLPLKERLLTEFELEAYEGVDVEMLRNLSITPQDILFMLSNDEVKSVADSMVVSRRGNARLNILRSFADATERLIENYAALAARDLAALRAAGIEITEAELGVKFEEATKAIFEHLDLNVDEEMRRDINTSKDKADILLNLGDDDVIIGEAKSFKNGDFAKYSSTSRQVKSYVQRCQSAGKRVNQVLLVAPSFSEDFIDAAEMDTEINISLLEAAGLKAILDAYQSRRNPNFSATLFTKGGLLKADRIASRI